MKELTDRQREIANFIRSFMVENGYAPSVRDVAAGFGISAKAAHDHIRALERKQVIKTSEGLSRSLEVISSEYAVNPEVIEVPLLGDIAAGKPLLSEENWNGSLQLPSSMFKNHKDMFYALKVHGESMIGIGIYDGDIAIIRHCESAPTGAIVVAKVGDEIQGLTLKRYFPGPNMVELRAENPNYGPIRTKDCEIHGTLQMIIRDYEVKGW